MEASCSSFSDTRTEVEIQKTFMETYISYALMSIWDGKCYWNRLKKT